MPAPAGRIQRRAGELHRATLWPQAQQAAAQQLGVDPVNLVAQAALESNWGRSMPRTAGGASSNNLFGIKATGGWGGDAVTAAHPGIPAAAARRARTAPSAPTPTRSAALRRIMSQCCAATRASARALSSRRMTSRRFASALQRGGYATDPDYAGKVSASPAGRRADRPAPAPVRRRLKFAERAADNRGTDRALGANHG